MRFASGLPLKRLQGISKKLGTHYPNEVHQKARFVSVNFETQSTSFTDEEDILRRTTNDETDIVVLRNDRVSVSRLAPYTKWSDFRAAFERALSTVLKERPKRQVERLGLRYINRIDIPYRDGVADFEDYVSVHIQIPKLIESIGAYELRFMTVHEGFRLHVQSATTDAPVPNTLAIALDIDVMTQNSVPSELEKIMVLFDQMRVEKNALFEAFVTDKARRLFDNV